MKQRSSVMPKCLVLALALGVYSVGTPSVFAAAQEGGRASAPTIDERTGRVLTQAFELLGKDDYAGARAALQGLNMDRLSPYERSRVEQIYYSIDAASENYAGARQHMQAALASGGLTEGETSQGQKAVASLYLSEENWVEGTKALEAWLNVPTNKVLPADYYLLAIAYYQQGQVDKALVPARKAVDMTETPQETWLQLLNSLLLGKEDYNAALPVTQKLVALYPRQASYWTQLSSIYAIKEDYANSLVVLELAHHAGLLTQSADLRRLADMYSVRELPYRAAVLLQESIDKKLIEPDGKVYEQLANALMNAREFEQSLPVFEKAAGLSSDGTLYARLGEMNAQLDNWQAAIDAYQKAVNKGGLKDNAQPVLMTGIAYYNLGKLSEARNWFQRASATASTKKIADAYITLINSKLN
ncbi:MAG: tetratricopeptide repeat protein [Pseudomonadales bacterium]|jgi:tetratricopeptide (TPR) repeat protein|nr:tetratricopeptide repeat protein [Pseudomonadales bacterium]